MASQIVPPAKRYRISLLLDIYGELLTEKQRTFLHQYYEEDLSFGEIAREHGVSRQAIFDSVRHGEDTLEKFERALRLVKNGWSRFIQEDRSTDSLAERLAGVRARLRDSAAFADKTAAILELDAIIAELRGDDAGEKE